MKIICDNCGAKYSIADEKVKGKVFKIRCKKCQESIVVRGDSQENAGAAEMASGGGGEVETKVFDYSGYKGNEPVWYVAVDGGEQQGPYTTDQMREYLQAGNVLPETYVWREGLEDWKMVSDVPEISGAPQGDKPEARSNVAAAAGPIGADPAGGGGLFGSPGADGGIGAGSGSLFGDTESAGGGLFDNAPDAHPAAGGGLFDAGGGAASPGDVFSSAPDMSTGGLFSADQNATATSKDGGGLFDGPVASGTGGDLFAATDSDDDGGGGIFASTEAQGAGPRVSAQAASMTGQRNENSVLFSLSNLQALAANTAEAPIGGADTGTGGLGGFGGGLGAAPAGEASGLIDIRAMASSLTAEAEKADDVDEMLSLGGGGFASTLGAPVLTAARPAGMSLGMKIAIGAGVLVLLIGLVIAAVTIAQKDTSAQDEQIAMLMKQIEAMKAQGASQSEILAKQQQLQQKRDEKAAIKSGDVVAMDDEKANEKTKQDDAKSKADAASGKSRKRGGSGAASDGDGDGDSKSASDDKKGSASDLLSESSKPSEPASGPSKKAKTNALDDLLGGGGSAAKKKPAATADKLSRQQVMSGMGAVAGSVQRCGAGKTGTFKIKAKIEPNGRVSQAQAVGQFAGTPAGTCAANAVKRARFPQSASPLNVTFPFKI
ncbi:MAG: zinc-ribbon domain-containing protein [Deltaproteobacteria bacterium]|nr:zinc-ribbon domain-containing protein [Deltaproteobacteria bacterium]